MTRGWEEPAPERRRLRTHLQLARAGENRCLGGGVEGWRKERVSQRQAQASLDHLELRVLTVEAALLLDFGQSAEEIHRTHVYLGEKVDQGAGILQGRRGGGGALHRRFGQDLRGRTLHFRI